MQGVHFIVLVCALVLVLATHEGSASPLFKVFCSGNPVYRGRVDSIVSPGQVSGHVHKVHGGSNFGPATTTQTPLEVFNDMRASPCTTCSIKDVDLSAYWHPDLYYRWPNGTLSLVPSGGLTIYYLFRGGSGAQEKPAWKAFPPGFRMVSGNPFKRSFNESSIAQQAVSFACLSNSSAPELNNLDAVKTRFCNNGLRMQVHFPQCWDGVNLDSPRHNTHVAFPTRPDGGNCPSTHPVRLPNLFFEAMYSISDFPHGTGTQPFVLAPGDATGYGFHGDFLNGWDQSVLQAVVSDATCDSEKTNNGNNVAACKTLAPYLQDRVVGACHLNRDVGLTEHLGFGQGIPSLPGNNPITYGPDDAAVPATGAPASTYQAPAAQRFHLKSVLTGKYATVRGFTNATLSVSSSVLTYHETFATTIWNSTHVGILSEHFNRFVSAGGTGNGLVPNKFSVSNWELFKFVAQANNRVAIIAERNKQYVTVQADNTLAATTKTTEAVGNAQLFELVVPNGGGLSV